MMKHVLKPGNQFVKFLEIILVKSTKGLTLSLINMEKAFIILTSLQ